ncbi:MAG: protein-glutamate O-methyltransferase CheR [Nitrospirota bacterium]
MSTVSVQSDECSLTQILDKLWFEKGYDFRGYKISSIKRRVTRRMGLNNIESYERYMSFLDSSPAEYHRLLYDLTIKVTGFFRDAYPFYILRDRVLPDIISMKQTKQSPPLSPRSANLVPPPLMGGGEGEGEKKEGEKKYFQGKDVANEIRIWCPGCATGEEPYSIGMLLLEALKKDAGRFNIKIFGTDICKDTLEKARLGVYHYSFIEVMEKGYRDNYFIPHDNNYRIKYCVRQMVRYGIHNLVNHPPISHLDLLLCRNVLIYFDRGLQEKVFRDFYYALRPKGYLVLGKSEVIINEFRDAFIEIDRKARVYQKI